MQSVEKVECIDGRNTHFIQLLDTLLKELWYDPVTVGGNFMLYHRL